MLSLTVLMALPGTYTSVRAVNQSGPTRYSPFGPFTQQLILHYYSDFDVMFSNFASGQIDVSDWPLQSSTDISNFCGNANFFCLGAQPELGYFGQEINSHPPFMGKALTTPRTVSPASFTVTSTGTACGVGSGSLAVTLRNQETGSTVLDSLNTLTVRNQPSGSPSATVSDSGGSSPNGVYNVPCILAGSYSITTTVYGGTTTLTIGSNTATTGTFNVNYNSQSNVNSATKNRALLGAAVAHLLDDPEFVSSTMTDVAQAPGGYMVTAQGVTAPTGTQCYTVLPASIQSYQGCTPPPAPGGPATQTDSAECQWNNHPWLNIVGCKTGATGHDLGPYNIGDDKVAVNTAFWNPGTTLLVGGYSGVSDLRAACDDFVSMGFSVVGGSNSTDCGHVALASQLTTDPGAYAHLDAAGQHIIYYVRINFGRQQFGQVIADSLNFLFGTPQNRGGQIGFVGTVCYGPCPQYTPKYYTFTQVTAPVFEDTSASGGSPDAWQLYTAGQGFDPTSDQYFLNRNSIQTGQVCAGVPAIKPNNYDFWCDPKTDTDGAAGEFAPTLVSSGQFFQRALLDELNNAVSIPGFAFVDTFVENNGWNFQQCTTTCVNTQSSLVNTVGFGTLAGAPYYTLLNARQVPGYSAPGGSTFAPGGGNPNLIRRGFSQDTTNLSPFTFNSVWEGDVLADIFDTMLGGDPNTGGGSLQFLDWGTTSHSSSFNPNEVGCNSINGCATGVTTQVWHIRNDWKFSDGNSVTANDVAYSIIAYRDVPSSLLQGYVVNVVSAVGLDCGSGQPCKTLQVKLQGQSALFDFNIGATQFVLEKSLWAPYCGDPPVAGGTCASPTFDPMYPSANSPGIEVGSGPWSCIAPISGTGVTAGHIGGPCAETSTGALTGGAITHDGRILLSENTFMARCCPTGTSATSSSLYKISYSDHNNDGVVNILDLADVASNYGTNNAYWCNANIACTGGLVGAVNLATVAIYFGHGITTPFTPSTLVQVDPRIDPFFCPAAGC